MNQRWGSDIMQHSKHYSRLWKWREWEIYLYPISCHWTRLEKVVATQRLTVKSRMTQVSTRSFVVFDRGRLINCNSNSKLWERSPQEDEVGGNFPWRGCTGICQVKDQARLSSDKLQNAKHSRAYVCVYVWCLNHRRCIKSIYYYFVLGIEENSSLTLFMIIRESFLSKRRIIIFFSDISEFR